MTDKVIRYWAELYWDLIVNHGEESKSEFWKIFDTTEFFQNVNMDREKFREYATNTENQDKYLAEVWLGDKHAYGTSIDNNDMKEIFNDR
jgi:hypothetical protein